MERDFIIFTCTLHRKVEKLPVWCCLFPEKWKFGLEIRRRWKHLACKRQPVKMFEKLGERIELPFTVEELEQQEKEVIRSRVGEFLRQEQIGQVITEGEISRFLLPDTYTDGKIIKQYFLKQWIELLIQRNHIEKKEVRLLIIDDNTTDIIPVLEPVVTDKNFVTICTARRDFYDAFSQKVLEDSGLMISFCSEEEVGGEQANVTVDFQTHEKGYRFYPRDSIVLDMTDNLRKEKYVAVKRKDIRYYRRLYENP